VFGPHFFSGACFIVAFFDETGACLAPMHLFSPLTPHLSPLTPHLSPLKNIDQRGTGRCGFNTENAIFEKYSPEIMNFAEMKSFS
jgi:hypothetical protein